MGLTIVDTVGWRILPRAGGPIVSVPRGGMRRLVQLAVLTLPILPGTLVAQDPDWTVLSVQMNADLSAADGSAEVTMRYVLGPDSGRMLPLTRPVRFELLGFGDATVERVSVSSGRSFELWPTQGSHRAASLFLSEVTAGSTVPLEVRYRVEAAVHEDGPRLRARIPTLTGPAEPIGEDGVGFTARLILPPEWVASEGFPSGLREDTDGVWSVSLQTSPSMVGFRGRSDGLWRPGVPLAVDLVTLLILLGFSAVGWRHLSGVARRARA